MPSERDTLTEARRLLNIPTTSVHFRDAAEPLLRALISEVERLRGVIEQTLDNNRHLADGDDCTLIDLKRSIHWK